LANSNAPPSCANSSRSSAPKKQPRKT